jgi:arsenate reductase
MVRVLFVCIHNSGRSQMAEAFANAVGGGAVEAWSAGLDPGELNPLVVEAMGEVGIDISRNRAKGVDEVLRSGERFSYVVTVCDEVSAERCPEFPGVERRLHWGFPDPAALTGTAAERLEGVRLVRDAIRAKIEEWCAACQGN